MKIQCVQKVQLVENFFKLLSNTFQSYGSFSNFYYRCKFKKRSRVDTQDLCEQHRIDPSRLCDLASLYLSGTKVAFEKLWMSWYWPIATALSLSKIWICEEKSSYLAKNNRPLVHNEWQKAKLTSNWWRKDKTHPTIQTSKIMARVECDSI